MSLDAVLRKTNGATFGDAQSQIQLLKSLFPNAVWDSVASPGELQGIDQSYLFESGDPIQNGRWPMSMCTIEESEGSVEIYIYDKGSNTDYLSLSIYGRVLPQHTLDTLAQSFSGVVSDLDGNILA